MNILKKVFVFNFIIIIFMIQTFSANAAGNETPSTEATGQAPTQKAALSNSMQEVLKILPLYFTDFSPYGFQDKKAAEIFNHEKTEAFNHENFGMFKYFYISFDNPSETLFGGEPESHPAGLGGMVFFSFLHYESEGH